MQQLQIVAVSTGNGKHWVGDGFPVNNMFSYHRDHDISPFLLLDYAGPMDFAPSVNPRGVEQHPHRGFETVTIVYAGELQHRDTAGNSGKIGAGDVQWMTAASGILHEEMHSEEFTKRGGKLEMVQLWVNLPAKYKMSPPHYQEISNAKIPVVSLPENSGMLRVIAGSFLGKQSPIKTFTSLNLYDIQLNANSTISLPITKGFNTMLLVLEGTIDIGGKKVGSSHLVKFGNKGDVVNISTQNHAKVLLLSGEPIDEPVVGAGPFVMNTKAEIEQAYSDFRAGNFLKF